MRIITAGRSWIDIDVLACGIAYNEFVGHQARLILQGDINATVSKTIRSMIPSVARDYRPENDDEFILVDISNPEHVSSFVDTNRVIEVWDHRTGFEDYWEEKLGKHNIELVGACATLIWEAFEQAQKPISTVSANLLYTAIISNTLNLTSKNTTSRDKEAVGRLKKLIDFPHNWIEQYYRETEESILSDPVSAVNNDTKEVSVRGKKVGIAQLEFWSIDDFMGSEQAQILLQHALKRYEKWFVTAPCIREGRNYFITPFPDVKGILSDGLDVVFNGNVGINGCVLLRKEIIQILNRDNDTQMQPAKAADV